MKNITIKLALKTDICIVSEKIKDYSIENGLTNICLFYHKNNCPPLVIGHECPIEIMRKINIIFNKIKKHTLPLPHYIPPYTVGEKWNLFTNELCTNASNNIPIKDPFSQYWLFSTSNDLQTWIYTINKRIIIEISPSYPWHYLDPKDDEPFETFEQFMKNYKPIAIHEISKETAQEWLKQAQDYLDIVEPQFEQWCKEHKDELYHLKEDA